MIWQFIQSLLSLFSRTSVPETSTIVPELSTPPAAPAAPDRFGPCVDFTLEQEGGRVDNKDDPGGRTNLGITQTTYNSWRGATDRDVWQITVDEAKQIYRANYWNVGDCASLTPPLDLVHFDSCVQFGPARALALFLINTHDPYAYINLRREYHEKRSLYPGQGQFLKGWLARCDRLEAEARKVT